MFWWRKRNEGFEWRDYVRTTILVRREQRRQRLKDVKEAAASHVKEAGRRGLDASVAGARSAGAGTWSGVKILGTRLNASARVVGAWVVRIGSTIASAIAAGAAGLWRAMSAAGRRIGEPLGPVLDPALAFARTPRPSLALKIVAALAGFGATYRAWAFGFDGDAIVATALFAGSAGLLLLAYMTDPARRRASERESLLARLGAHQFELPGERRLSGARLGLAALAVAGVTTIGCALYYYGLPISVASLTSTPVTTGALPEHDPRKLEGRAVAVTGDTLRIAGTRVVLDGIEAPEAAQSCARKDGGTWKCGAAAKDALAEIVRGRRVSCDVLGEENAARRARCYVGGSDVAEELVRTGKVFADGGFWGSYASIESDAETQKVGLWEGEAERPQEYRDKRWQEASKTAPDGCPIKGAVRAGERTYVLPWAPSYDGIRLRESKGERWFCSESEAEAAGWTRGSQS